MTNKAVLTKEQSQILDHLLNKKSKSDVVRLLLSSFPNKVKDKFGSLDQLCRALYWGYEIEKTKEEKVIAYYESLWEALEIRKIIVVEHVLQLLGWTVDDRRIQPPDDD